MNYFVREDYLCHGDNGCGSPIKKIQIVSEEEAKYWDNLDKQIKEQERQKK